jgi:hypothetical protein
MFNVLIVTSFNSFLDLVQNNEFIILLPLRYTAIINVSLLYYKLYCKLKSWYLYRVILLKLKYYFYFTISSQILLNFIIGS